VNLRLGEEKPMTRGPYFSSLRTDPRFPPWTLRDRK
jgi:hypothetical protein